MARATESGGPIPAAQQAELQRCANRINIEEPTHGTIAGALDADRLYANALRGARRFARLPPPPDGKPVAPPDECATRGNRAYPHAIRIPHWPRLARPRRGRRDAEGSLALSQGQPGADVAGRPAARAQRADR